MVAPVKTPALSRADVLKIVSGECDDFVRRFMQANMSHFETLESPDVTKGEQQLMWHYIFQCFQAEAEMTLQNTLLFWGLAISTKFEEDFIDAAQSNGALDGFLGMTDYKKFIEQMYTVVQQKKSGALPAAVEPSSLRTPHENKATEQRLSEIDMRLRTLEQERNELMVERRRLLGCEVAPTVSSSLRDAIARARWNDEVGLD